MIPAVNSRTCDAITLAEPAEPTEWKRTYYVDPEAGDDAADGISASTALRSFERFDTSGARHLSLQADTQVALKRGTALRLTCTVQLHGNDSGWVRYTSYGDAALPKPIILGSVGVPAADWSSPDADGLRTLDWSPYLDGTGDRSLSGVEQGPGNLWFFDAASALAHLTRWG